MTDQEAFVSSRPDIREITVTTEETLWVDVARFFEEYDAEWQEFLDGDEPTDKDREEFIHETVSEIAGDDLLDFTVDGPKGHVSESFVSDIDIRKPR